MQRIGLDVRYLSHGITGGVRTYVSHLASELPRVAPGVEFVFYADTKAPLELSDIPANVAVRRLPWRSTLSSVVNDFRIARWMDRDAVDVAHFPGNHGTKGRFRFVVTVHDTLNLFPLSQHLRGFGKTPRKVAMMLYLGWQTRRALQEADHVITVSEHARQDIALRSGCSLDRITAIHEAAASCFARIHEGARLEAVRARHRAPRLTLLADAIKNPACLLRAWAMIDGETRRDAGILFFSREPAPRQELAVALAGDKRLHFIKQPSTTELVELFNIADCFVFPSFYEGFGLPLVEAMRCGAAVVASSRGAIPEVLGGAGLVFDVERPGELASHLTRVLKDDALRRQLRERSLRRSEAFDWTTCARRTVDVYRTVLQARRAPSP